MINTKRNKILIFFGLLVIIFALAVLLYRPVVFQEGNPWPEIKAISRLTFVKSSMVKLLGSDNKYLTKSQGGPQAVDAFMRDKGYEFTDQMGSGYFYQSSDKAVVLTRRQYSRFYTIWSVTENKSDNLFEELQECLPKSDTASHEKCNELLKKITDYNSCVNAGFSVMELRPRQCVTPSGQTFIQEN